MTDATINRFVARGDAAARGAFTPNPATPGSGPDHGYVWYETDTGDLYAWDGSAWDKVVDISVINSALQGSLGATDNALLRADGTGGATAQGSAITMSDAGALTFPDDVRQTFNPGANAAGLNVGAVAGDPGTPSNGDLWYDSTANELTARINGANVNLGAASGIGGGSGATDNVIIRADGTGGATVQGGGVMTLSDAGVLGFPDGVRQTFNPDGTNAGLNVGAQAGDPSSLSDGDVWYNSTAGILKARTASATVPLTGYVVIASGSTGTVANIDFTNLGGYSELLFIARDITTSSSGFRQVLASVDNGSTFYTTSGNYIRVNSDGTQTNDTVLAGTSSAGTTARGTVMHLVNNVSGYDKVAINPFGTILFVASANAINALRYQNSAGNLNGGTYVLLGR